MGNQSQSGGMDRGHQVGCPKLRDPQAPNCYCTFVETPTAPIRPDSARVYQSIAGFRKTLAQYPDLPAPLLREMLELTLEAAELHQQAIDRMQDMLDMRSAHARA